MTLRRLGLAAVAGAVAAVVWRTADWAAVARAGDALVARPLPLAAAMAAYTLAFVLRACAWGPLLPAPVALGRRFRAILAMLAVNHALPGPVGEVARARLVTGDQPAPARRRRRRSGSAAAATPAAATPAAATPAAREAALTFRDALASVAAARVVDVGALALLAMIAASVAGEAPRWLRLLAPGAALLPLAAWMVARRRGAALTGVQAARVAAWAVPSWALEAGVILVVAQAAGVQLSPAAALLATCGGVMAQVAAVLPGGVGTYEAGVASVLVPLGVPLGEAVGVAATAHAVKFAFAFTAGGLALAWSRPAGDRPLRERAQNPSVATLIQGGGRAADVRP